MQKLSLFSKYEFEGYWWIDADTNKYPGKLTLSPSGIILNIFGIELDRANFSTFGHNVGDLVFGQSVDGTRFTLLHAFTSSMNEYYDDNSHIACTSVEITANQCAAGAHILDLSIIAEYDIYVNFHGLEDWLMHVPYRHTSHVQDGKYSRTVQIAATDALIDCRISSLGTNISSVHWLSHSLGSPTGISSTCNAYIITKINHNITFNDVIGHAYSITRLWSLLCGVHICPRNIFLQKLYDAEDRRKVDTIHMYAPIGEDEKIDSVHPANSITNFEIIREQLPKVIDQWFAKETEMRAMRGLFFKSFKTHRKHQYDITQFLNFIAALEIFARGCNPKGLISKSTAKKLRASLAAVIKKEVSGDAQSAIIAKMAHIHDPTLHDKLQSIANNIDNQTRQYFPILSKKMLKRIVFTRNYYTHYDQTAKSSKKLIGDDEMFDVTDQLCVLVMLILLSDIGIAENIIMERIQCNWLRRHAITTTH